MTTKYSLTNVMIALRPSTAAARCHATSEHRLRLRRVELARIWASWGGEGRIPRVGVGHASSSLARTYIVDVAPLAASGHIGGLEDDGSRCSGKT